MYVIELFSDKADQVRLVTFLLSALLAVTVLLINQWFTSRKARREYLIGKIEELSKLSIEYTELCSEILDDIRKQDMDPSTDFPTVTVAHFNRVQSLIRQMELICGLYFPTSGFDSNNYRLWNMAILEHLEKGWYAEDGVTTCMWEDAKQHIIDSDAKLAVACSRLMKRYGYKT